MNTPSSREADRIALAAQVAAFSGSIEVLPSFPERPTYRKRTSWIDPDTKLTRKGKKPPRVLCASDKLEHQRAMRRRGTALLRQDWPELNLAQLAVDTGVHVTTIQYRLGIGQTFEQATRRGSA